MKTLKSCASALRTILHSWIGKWRRQRSGHLCLWLNIRFYGLLSNEKLVSPSACQLLTRSVRTDESRCPICPTSSLHFIHSIKMIILDLFYDLLHLDVPAVCDSYEAALKSTCTYPYTSVWTRKDSSFYAVGHFPEVKHEYSFFHRSYMESNNVWRRLHVCGQWGSCEITASIIDKVSWMCHLSIFFHESSAVNGNRDIHFTDLVSSLLVFFIPRPNFLDSHTALMLLTFIDAGFIEVILVSLRDTKTVDQRFPTLTKSLLNLIRIF